MDTKAAFGAAGGIALTVAGGVSALLLTMGPSGPVSASAESDGGAVVAQYVDELGNPIDVSQLAEVAVEVADEMEAPHEADEDDDEEYGEEDDD